uniref:Uncharacterized protein n=1 Tax=Rhizophora mucronata TaxID=61149 RepID=A0A2P2M917_RHIMU
MMAIAFSLPDLRTSGKNSLIMDLFICLGFLKILWCD